ncbi:MAG TPA: carboxylating nicotinate-nucleotide diphosphorylase [Oligoflexia bacterium]|nr:carboxylating nicotinate-nucleotide diphosphorylase [Oligoflexia bacterium]
MGDLKNLLPDLLNDSLVDNLIDLSLLEDGISNDLTTLATGCAEVGRTVRATVIAKKTTIAAGGILSRKVLQRAGFSEKVTVSILADDGASLGDKAPWIILEGSANAILRTERTILNFLMRMCGIASHTRQIVTLLEGTNCKLLHTRKTVPGHRLTDIYATLVGGAYPHRKSLSDAILVKENHLRASQSLQHLKDGIAKFRDQASFVEIEVSNFIELKYAMENKPNRVMLDNFSVADVQKAVNLFGSAVELEASGNINLETVRAYAETGVDYVSMGAITHSSPAADLSLLFDFS